MGIQKNVAYTTILTTSNYIFPLLVYPYVSRVLGVANIGLCNFIDNVINYFILFSMMGINIMGTRQIATDKAKGRSLDNSYSSLIVMGSITTFVALIILIIVTYIVPDLREHKEMMFFGGVKVLSNFFLMEWFYKGLEDFKYITVRTIVVKCCYIACIYIFVREETDYNIYYLLTVLMVTGNSIINTIYSSKFVRFRLKLVRLGEVAKPFFILGFYMLVTSFCTSFNVIYLGFTTNDTQVGYYTTATKLYSILLAFFTGVTSVLMPRMSNLLVLNKVDEFKNLLGRTSSVLFAYAIPIIVLCVIFAPQIIYLISGPEYEGAVTPMRIVMPLMLIIGYEQIAVIQGLMPLRKDKTIMMNAACSAIVSLILNILLVRHIAAIGSSIAWISSEFTILVLSQIALSKFIGFQYPFKSLFKSIAFYIPLAIILLAVELISSNRFYWVYLIIASFLTGIYTLVIQLKFLHNPVLTGIYDSVTLKIKNFV